MARKKKRAPPLNYDEKYRQIKESKFDVNVSKPTTPSTKAMVTRYHRLLFGGRTSSGHYIRGIARNYNPTESKYSDDIRAIWNIKGTPRIRNAYIPKFLGSISSVSDNFITFKTKAGKFQILNVSPKDLATATKEERAKLLKPLKGKSAQIVIGTSIQTIVFDEIDDLDDALDIVVESAGEEAPIRILV